MKLSGNRFIEAIMGVRASQMIQPTFGETPFANWHGEMTDAKVALVTTAGVHLNTQMPFDVEAGDHTVHFIPAKTRADELMVTHTHFDRSDADLDIECIFPLATLRQLAEDNRIGSVAETHYGLMGYIPESSGLISESIPAMIRQIKEEQVQVVILNPG